MKLAQFLVSVGMLLLLSSIPIIFAGLFYTMIGNEEQLLTIDTLIGKGAFALIAIGITTTGLHKIITTTIYRKKTYAVLLPATLGIYVLLISTYLFVRVCFPIVEPIPKTLNYIQLFVYFTSIVWYSSLSIIISSINRK